MVRRNLQLGNNRVLEHGPYLGQVDATDMFAAMLVKGPAGAIPRDSRLRHRDAGGALEILIDFHVDTDYECSRPTASSKNHNPVQPKCFPASNRRPTKRGP